MKKIILVAMTALLSLLSLPNIAYADQKQPPLVIIVPYPPGGDTDILARLFAIKYTEKTGRTTVVENKPGAAGIIGFMHISKAPGDGNLIGLVPRTLATAPYFNPGAAKYDPKTDFIPISQLTGHGMFIAVNADTGVKSIAELIEATKKGTVVAYGTPGAASPQHIFGEMFNSATKTNMLHVPFKGNLEVINSLMNNTIQLTFNTLLPLVPLVEAGKINIIAVAAPLRSSFLPNVPTLEEQGIKGINFESWLGFVGPKDMNFKIAIEFNKVFSEIARQPDVQERLKKLGMTPIANDATVFRDTIHRASDRFLKLSKELRIE